MCIIACANDNVKEFLRTLIQRFAWEQIRMCDILSTCFKLDIINISHMGLLTDT